MLHHRPSTREADVLLPIVLKLGHASQALSRLNTLVFSRHAVSIILVTESHSVKKKVNSSDRSHIRLSKRWGEIQENPKKRETSLRIDLSPFVPVVTVK